MVMDNPDQKKRKRKYNRDSVAETLAKWKEKNTAQFASCGVPKVQAKGSKKGCCVKGKGGPENSLCHYRGFFFFFWEEEYFNNLKSQL